MGTPLGLLLLATLASGPGEVTLVAAGDVMLGGHLAKALRELGLSGDAAYGYPFAKVSDLFAGADLSVVNLEGPLTEGGERLGKKFNFRGRPELAKVLLWGHVGAVSLANNHMLDYGELGLRDTLAALDALGVAHFGAGLTLADARRPVVVGCHGTKIAILGYAYLGTPPIEPARIWATEQRPGVAGAAGDLPRLAEMVREDVAAAKALAPLVVVFFHFGVEKQHTVDAAQRLLARAAAEAGATLVLGAHPHVPEGIEWVDGVPVVYSLGNFIFGGKHNPVGLDGMVVRATLSGRGRSVEVLPMRLGTAEAPFQPTPLAGPERQAMRRELEGYSRTLSAAPGNL